MGSIFNGEIKLEFNYLKFNILKNQFIVVVLHSYYSFKLVLYEQITSVWKNYLDNRTKIWNLPQGLIGWDLGNVTQNNTLEYLDLIALNLSVFQTATQI